MITKINTTIIYDGTDFGYDAHEKLMEKINEAIVPKFRCKASHWRVVEPDIDDLQRLEEMREWKTTPTTSSTES